MKKKLFLLLTALLMLVPVSACAKAPFEKKEISVDELAAMMDDRDTFVLMVERENCPFCEALNSYIERTKNEHAGTVVYMIDITAMDLKKPDADAKTLVSSTKEGQLFLELFPYFYYTPTMYHVQDGIPVNAGIGIDVNTDQVSLWNTDSSADLNTARQVEVWDYIEGTGIQS